MFGSQDHDWLFLFFFCNSAPHTHTEKARVSSTFNLTNDYGALELMYSLFNLHSRQVHCLHVLCITYLSTSTPSILLQKSLKILSQKNPRNPERTWFHCLPQVWSTAGGMVIITVLYYYKAASELLSQVLYPPPHSKACTWKWLRGKWHSWRSLYYRLLQHNSLALKMQ